MSKFRQKNIMLREDPLGYFLHRAEESKDRAKRWEERSVAFTEKHPQVENIINSILCVVCVLGLVGWLWRMI